MGAQILEELIFELDMNWVRAMAGRGNRCRDSISEASRHPEGLICVSCLVLSELGKVAEKTGCGVS